MGKVLCPALLKRQSFFRQAKHQTKPLYTGSVLPHPLRPIAPRYDLENHEAFEHYRIYPRTATEPGKTNNDAVRHWSSNRTALLATSPSQEPHEMPRYPR